STLCLRLDAHVYGSVPSQAAAMRKVIRILPGLVLLHVLASAICAETLTAEAVLKAINEATADRPPNLAGQDLSGLDLSNLDFRQADLSGANLFGAKLVAANLSGANLSGANLDAAWITRTNFSGANLSKTSLFGPVVYTGLQVVPSQAPNFANA